MASEHTFGAIFVNLCLCILFYYLVIGLWFPIDTTMLLIAIVIDRWVSHNKIRRHIDRVKVCQRCVLFTCLFSARMSLLLHLIFAVRAWVEPLVLFAQGALPIRQVIKLGLSLWRLSALIAALILAASSAIFLQVLDVLLPFVAHARGLVCHQAVARNEQLVVFKWILNKHLGRRCFTLVRSGVLNLTSVALAGPLVTSSLGNLHPIATFMRLLIIRGKFPAFEELSFFCTMHSILERLWFRCPTLVDIWERLGAASRLLTMWLWLIDYTQSSTWLCIVCSRRNYDDLIELDRLVAAYAGPALLVWPWGQRLVELWRRQSIRRLLSWIILIMSGWKWRL